MEKRRVLFVEDDQLTVNLYTKLLTVWGYDVHYANDGYIALQMMENQAYDLLLTDNQLPFMTGSELIKQVSQTNPRMKTIMITGEDQEKLTLMTQTTVLTKPVMPDYLRFEISNSLSKQSLRKSA